MKNLKNLKNLFILLFPIILTGCWDKVELDDRGLVLSLGIDAYNQEEDSPLDSAKNGIYTVSMDIPDVSAVAKSSQSSGEAVVREGYSEKPKRSNVKSAVGETVYSTMKLIDTYTSQKLYYGHTKVVILGQDLLKNETYLKEVIDALERNQEISRKLIVLSTKGRAKDILNSVPEKAKDLGLFINDFYKSNKGSIKFTFRKDLENIIQDLLSTQNTVIPQIEIEDGKINLKGLSVIKDYKIVGFLNDEMTKTFLWLKKGEKFEGEISVKFGESFVPLKITKNKLDITIEDNDSNILTNIGLKIEGNIGEYMLTKNIMLDTDKYKELEREFEAKIKMDILNFLYVIQNEFKADVIGIKKICMKNYNDIYKKFNLDKNSIYKDMLFNVNVDVKIKSSGTIK